MSLLRRYQNEIANMFLLEKLALRIRYAFERKYLRYKRPKPVSLDVKNKI